MRTQPNERVLHVVRLLEQLAYDVTSAVEHVARELSQVGIYPNDTLAERTSGGDVTATWPPDTTINAFELRTRREDIRDCIDAVESTVASLRFVVDETRKIRTGAPELFAVTDDEGRCSGKVNPTCEQWASDQRLADGSTVAHLCVACFATACMVCGNEAQSNRRVNGVPAGEACYKRHLRARTATTAGDAA